ncbi:MAG TPA: hypothetical protein VHD87_15485 [Acidimicrobiales bacterium]|nr:hypothetical protein [Acidimicrobiales bacterium]
MTTASRCWQHFAAARTPVWQRPAAEPPAVARVADMSQAERSQREDLNRFVLAGQRQHLEALAGRGVRTSVGRQAVALELEERQARVAYLEEEQAALRAARSWRGRLGRVLRGRRS